MDLRAEIKPIFDRFPSTGNIRFSEIRAENQDFGGSFEPPPDPLETGSESK